ncbi:DNA-binding protein [Streptomyces sp. NPDC060011]|uniref:DNA-binding protein n=1 Tax=Streptomyces sp. NPDC060011 TaxID=3347037 RepID=UPI0036B398A8
MARTALASLDEVAEYLGLPPNTVRNQVSRQVGVGRYSFRVGKYRRWEWSDVYAFVDSQKPARSEVA